MKSTILIIAFAATFCWNASANSIDSETVNVEVRRQGKDENGEPKETVLKVSLRVSIQAGIVHLNGHRLDHAVVSAVHTKVEYDEYSDGTLLKHSKGKIQVRVMVTEVNAPVKHLVVQEEIVEVNGEEVTQIEIKEVVLHVDGNNNEIIEKRQITTVNVKESKIHGMPRKDDRHIRGMRRHGKHPHRGFHATDRDMRRMNGVPVSDRLPPHFPDHPMRAGNGHDEDEDEDDHEFHGDGHRRHHNRRHHRHRGHHGRLGKKFCSWFHHLPTGVRIFSVIGTVFIGLALVTCCVKCCCARRAKRARAYELPSKEAPKVELYDDEEMDTAGPLPTKHPLDKAQLIVNS